MYFGFRRRVRHPLYPQLAADPAIRARQATKVLAGTLEELQQAALAGARASHMVLVLAKEGRPFLTQSERDFLWATFHVPAYLLLRDGKGRVLAYECEAQDGFHLHRDDFVLDGANLLSTPCECGRSGNRLQVPSSANIEGLAAGR